MSDEKSTGERVEPGPLEVGLLYKLLQAQRDTLALMKEQIPRGITFQQEETVTFASPWNLDFLKERPHHLLHRVELISKGPNSVYARIEIEGENPYEITIENREVIPIDVKRPGIQKIYFRVASGETATVKVIGLY